MGAPLIYMDNAATSFPKPESVYGAVSEAMRKAGGNPGRSAHTLALAADRLIFEAREAVAQLLGIKDSANLIFTSSATESLNLAIKGLLKPGDHVITSAIEHDAVARPLASLTETGVHVTRIPCNAEGVIEPSSVMAAITDRTTLVAVTHASNVTGAIQPVAEIGAMLRKRKVPFLVDASQTAGSCPIDVEDFCIDLLAAPGHKALLGPPGTGILYVSPAMTLTPLKDGGGGHLTAGSDDAMERPERYEAGTMNTPGIAGLGAGVRFILETGVEKIRAHEVSLMVQLLEGMQGMTQLTLYGPTEAEKRGSLIAFNVKGMDPSVVAYRLDSEFGIMTRAGLHCAPEAHRAIHTYPSGAVRLSPGWFNRAEEIGRVLDALSAIAGEGAR